VCSGIMNEREVGEGSESVANGMEPRCALGLGNKITPRAKGLGNFPGGPTDHPQQQISLASELSTEARGKWQLQKRSSTRILRQHKKQSQLFMKDRSILWFLRTLTLRLGLCLQNNLLVDRRHHHHLLRCEVSLALDH